MKSLSETVKDGDQRKRQLQEQIDQLNEECAKLAAQGNFIFCFWEGDILTVATEHTVSRLQCFIGHSYMLCGSWVHIM